MAVMPKHSQANYTSTNLKITKKCIIMKAETVCYSNKQSTAPQQQFKSQWDKLTGTEVGYVMSTYIRKDFVLEAIQRVR